MNWKKIVSMTLLGLFLGVLSIFLLPEPSGGVGIDFWYAVIQIPGLYFVLGFALSLSSLPINWWLKGTISGAIFSLPPIFTYSLVGESSISVIILWCFLFLISGVVAGLILEAVGKLFGPTASP